MDLLKQGTTTARASSAAVTFPDTIINRCVRRCLIFMDKAGYSPLLTHFVCYTDCDKLDLWRTPESCRGVSLLK